MDEIIANIRLLARKYVETNEEFYSQLIAQSTVPAVHVHHTILSLAIKSKSNNSPVTNATATLSTSKKSGISDVNGHATIEQVRKGSATLTIKVPGQSNYITLVSLVAGQENHFDVLV